MPEFIFISQAEGSIHINSDFNFSIFLSEFCDDTPISYVLNWQVLVGE